ncbi:MAG TPA: HAD family phosphatase [Anaerolineales bacterium]|nr:HAD family phosphatase [Anaerolineales bacterium]
MNIKAIFFDFGGVIQRTEYQSPRQQLAQKFGMEYEDIDNIVFNSPTAKQATVGEIKVSEHWSAIAKRFKLNKDEIIKFENEFFAGDVIDHELMQFIRSLRPKYKVGLISNAWSDMREYLIKQKLDDAFDTLTISAEVKSAKPEAKIYLHALEQAEIKASEAVFVDDVSANIEACQKLGMHGILFRDVNEVMKEIKKLLK